MKLKIFFSLFLLFAFSCNDESPSIVGKWDFNKSCNNNLFVACFPAEALSYIITLEITPSKIISYQNNEIISEREYILEEGFIRFKEGEPSVQQFFLDENILTIADTCFECNYFVYSRQ